MEIDIEKLKQFAALLNEFIVFLETKATVEEPELIIEEPEPIEEPVIEEPIIVEPTIEELIVEEPVIEESIEEPIEEPIESPIVEPVDESGNGDIGAVEEPVEIVEQEPIIEEPEPEIPDIDMIVGEVLDGKWGSGAKRKANLEAAGYNYDEIQNRVNEILTVVDEVFDGKWGNGDVRKQKLEEAGYNYKVIQDRINKVIASRTTIPEDICAWAKKIADMKKYTYKKWVSSNVKTHQCPICHPGSGDGWNCIGFAFACWHHGGNIPCNCSCGVVANDTWEKILKAKTDKEALELAQKYIGIKNIQVIRNTNGIPQSQLKAGDIIAFYVDGNTYQHTALYVGNGLMADSSGGNSGKYVTYGKKIRSGLKVAIRWTGDAKSKSVDTLAKEVLNGFWGSGDLRKLNLTTAGCDYDKIQSKINELLKENP